MRTLFRDSRLARDFDERGYVVVRLLSDGDLAYLQGLYSQFDKREYHAILEVVEAEPLNTAVDALLSERLAHYLQDYDVVGGAFVTKHGSKGLYEPHQDFTWVDEGITCMVSVWMPLDDVTLDNGVLGIIPGSHRLPLPFHRIQLQYADPSLTEYFDLVPVRRGSAILFNSRAIHGSLPNWTRASRVTLIGAAKHESAPLVAYAMDGEEPDVARMHAVDVEFMRSRSLNDVRQEVLQGRCVGINDFPFLGRIRVVKPALNADEWKALLHKNDIPVNPEVQAIFARYAPTA